MAALPATTETPPATTAVVRPNQPADAPALALPSSGPDDHEIISTPARRPRSRSGIVSFHSAPRKMPLTPSPAPATTSIASASHKDCARPKPTMPTPHAAAASVIARPLWCTRADQPDVSIAAIPPTAGAAHSRPTTDVPP